MDSFHRRAIRPRSQPVVAENQSPSLRAGGGRVRADTRLVEAGLVSSRTAAQRAISEGRVFWLGRLVVKASQEVPADASLEVTGGDDYVSRGGTKLRGALDHCGFDVSGKICLDVGQSTGGFTDCLLQAGALLVVGVDVGHDQLHSKLRNDKRVVFFEGLNARHMTRDSLGHHCPQKGFDFVVADASFISLTLLLPALRDLVAKHGRLLLLVKPQFEVGRSGLGKGGLVRDPVLYLSVRTQMIAEAERLGFAVQDYFDSSITGSDGNREFFICLRLCETLTGHELSVGDTGNESTIKMNHDTLTSGELKRKK